MNAAQKTITLPLLLLSATLLNSARAGQLNNSSYRPSKIVVSSVSAIGKMDDWAVRSALNKHRNDPFPLCTLPKTKNKYSLRGRIFIRATIQANRTLRIDRLDATKDHASLTNCVKKALTGWKIGRSAADKGTEISFRFYVSFPNYAGRTALSKTAKGGTSLSILGTSRRGSTSSSYKGLGKGYGRYRSSSARSYNKPKATLGQLKISGAHSHSVVEWALKQMRLQSDLTYCQSSWKRRKKGKPYVKGKATLKLRIGPVGALEKVEVTDPGFSDVDLQKCIFEKAARLTLPKAKSATNISVVITYK